MKEKDELELILKLIGKHNLPLNPILGNAIKEIIDDCSEKTETVHCDKMDGCNSSHDLEDKTDDFHLSLPENNDIAEKSENVFDCKIENKANQCFIINKNGKRIYSSSGKLKILNGKVYRILYNNSAISINPIEWDENKDKYRLGERIIYAQKTSSLYSSVNKDNYLDEIKGIMYEQITGEYKVNVGDRWYGCIEDKVDSGASQSEKPSEDPVPKKESLPESSTIIQKDDLKMIDFGQHSVAIIGNIESHANHLKAMGGYAMAKTRWGKAWIFSSLKKDRLQAYIDEHTSVVKSKDNNQVKTSSRFLIRIQYPNGSTFSSEDVGESLVDVIMYAGFEIVRQLNIQCMGDDLVSYRLSKNKTHREHQKEIVSGFYVCISPSIDLIYQQILSINERCHLRLKVEKVFLDERGKPKPIQETFSNLEQIPYSDYSSNNNNSFKGKQSLSKQGSSSESRKVTRKSKSSKRKPKSFEDKQQLERCRFVLRIVKEYVRQHPNISYESLLRVFPASLNHNKSKGVIKLYSDVMKNSKIIPNYRNYFFLSINDMIVLANGSTIVVHNQWKKDFIDFLKVAKRLFEVESSDHFHPTDRYSSNDSNKRNESLPIICKHEDDDRIGYIIRLLPSQKKAVIVGVSVDDEGYKKLEILTNDCQFKEIDDNPYLYDYLYQDW